MRTVSVCIPTYNQVDFIQKAIFSAYNQTLRPIEIIVSNDCSTDNTKHVLENVASKVPILKVINQPNNLGIAKNTDACLRAASGDFIVRLDSDDYLDTNYCEKLADLLVKFPEAGYAHANVKEIDQYGTITNDRVLFRKQIYEDSNKALKAAAIGYRVAANIIMFRKTALQSVNYISSRPNYVEDYHLACHLADHNWGNVFCDEFLSYYRVWIDTGKVRQKRKLMEISGIYSVFVNVLEPAFIKKKLNLSVLVKSRTQYAVTLADCLSWDVYSNDERDELILWLLRISDSSKSKFFIWIYKNGYGRIFVLKSQGLKALKSYLKKVYLKFPL